MDSRSGSADISEDCGELSRLRRERHRLLLRVSGGRISVAAGEGGERQTETSVNTANPPFFRRTAAPKRSLRLTCELWNDGRRVLVQVVHAPSDGVRGHGHPGHDHPAVVRVQGGRQARQAAVVDHGEVAELLDLLPAVQPLLQARRHLRQGFPGANQPINQSIF